MHAVPPDKENNEIYANYHTHGLEETKNHPDFQIVFPVHPQIAHEIFWNFVRHVKKGVIYKPNTFVPEIIENFDVELMETTDEETGNTILRVILPDPNGLFPDDDNCDLIYKGHNYQKKYKKNNCLN